LTKQNSATTLDANVQPKTINVLLITI